MPRFEQTKGEAVEPFVLTTTILAYPATNEQRAQLRERLLQLSKEFAHDMAGAVQNVPGVRRTKNHGYLSH